ncbi:hypothetical protein HDU99_007479, partial [Rhizoclosmatium hyalinum]
MNARPLTPLLRRTQFDVIQNQDNRLIRTLQIGTRSAPVGGASSPLPGTPTVSGVSHEKENFGVAVPVVAVLAAPPVA